LDKVRNSMKHSIDGRSVADEKTRTEPSENGERRGGRLDGTKRICGSSSLINQDGQTKLHLLCQNNTCSKEEIDELIIAFPAALSKRDVYGRSVSSMQRKGKLCHFSRVHVLHVTDVPFSATVLCIEARV